MTQWAPILERLLARVEISGACVEWRGSRNRDGYGTIRHNGRSAKVHRVTWELFKGPIPDGMHVLHRCDNPPCLNPEHLFLGTDQDNSNDMVSKGRSIFGTAHYATQLTVDNVYTIRRLHPQMAIARLARLFSVGESTIRYIVRRVTWKHLPEVAQHGDT